MFPIPVVVQAFIAGAAAGRQICDLFDDGRFSSSCIRAGLFLLQPKPSAFLVAMVRLYVLVRLSSHCDVAS